MTKRRRYDGTCEWDGCANECTRRWCDEHREDAYKRRQQENHQRRMQNPTYVASLRQQKREYMSAKRSAWSSLDKHLANQKRRFSRYGVGLSWFHQQIERQCGLCAICQQIPTGERPWHVDHCHDTGAVRGLLCSGCNTGIGHLKDNPTVMRSAADYIEAHRTRANAA